MNTLKKGHIAWNLTETEYVRVDPGDIIAFYFTGVNPIPYTESECYSRRDQLRYLSSPESMEVGQTYTFGVAPLTMNPCRRYSVQTLVRKYMRLFPYPPCGATDLSTGLFMWQGETFHRDNVCVIYLEFFCHFHFCLCTLSQRYAKLYCMRFVCGLK